MALRTTMRSPERVMAIGGFGTGKSHGWLSIARLSQVTGSDAKFYVLDTDFAIDRMLSTSFSDLNNVEHHPAPDWEDCESFVKTVVPKIRPNHDWIIVDMIDITWDQVQAWYTQQIWQEDIGIFFLEARKQLKGEKGNLQPFAGWTDWQVINKVYQSWIARMIFKSKAHVYLTNKVEVLDSSKEKNQDVLVTYGAFGIKPKGQKHIGNQVHTVLLFSAPRKDDWRIVTVKDRGPVYFQGDKLEDFAYQYLVEKARWEL